VFVLHFPGGAVLSPPVTTNSVPAEQPTENVVSAVSRFIHHYFLALLVGSYVLAGIWPALGLHIRNISFGQITLRGETLQLTLPMLMLSFLLFNGGLGVDTGGMKALFRQPRVLFAGLAGNCLLPLLFIGVLALAMRLWPDPDEVQSTLVGLVLIAAVPIAGSSTAWSQNANGNMALALGLVLASTLLSPLLSPLTFEFGQHMTRGHYAQTMDAMEGISTGFFLFLCVLLPSVLGMAARRGVQAAKLTSALPLAKLINSVNLILLNYSNASVSLPKLIAHPDWDFLVVVLVAVTGMCVCAFGAGHWLARRLGVDEGQRTSLMFGLGMNNNGTGLVLASATFANHPRVLLPILFYNLVQHLVAGFVDKYMTRQAARPA
jgi:BASS family bile acid:Na+ symporter